MMIYIFSFSTTIST